MTPEIKDLVERLRNYTFADVHNDNLLGDSATLITNLSNNLDKRDEFIVSKGLWDEFVGQLPQSEPPNG